MRIGICEDEQIIREQLTMLIKAYPTDEPIEVAAYVTGEDLLADTKGFDFSKKFIAYFLKKAPFVT